MKTLLQSLSSLSAIIEGSDIRVISDVLDFYEKIPIAHTNLANVRRKLKSRYPFLFQRQPQCGAEDLQLQRIPTHVMDSFMASNITEESLKSFVETQEEKIMQCQKEVQMLFPVERSKHVFRLKDYQHFLEASNKYCDKRSIMDIVGMRVVPKEAAFFPAMIQHMEVSFQGRIDFRLNTFAYTDREMKEVLGKYSAYHRAIHYYFSLGDFFIEIQMKTPAIDQWSMLHHDTLYKSKVPITAQEKQAIMTFGHISNVVDYYRMLQA